MTDKLMGDYTLREARDICATFYTACEDEEDDEMVKHTGNLSLKFVRDYCRHYHNCANCVFTNICCTMPDEWELSDDDFEPRKPLKDWTLGEVERHCHEHNDCNKCELSNWCEKVCKSYPWSWEMEEYDR